MSELNQAVAVVTGASSGIGKAIALELLKQGAQVCLVGRNRDRLDQSLVQAGEHASRGRVYEADLILEEDIHRLQASILNNYSAVQILVHCAGLFSMGSLETSDVEMFDRQYRVNVRAPYLLTQLFLPSLRAQRGQLVFVNSSMGLRSRGTLSQYAATKHALRAIADSIREEVNADGIRVISVYPGRTASVMQEQIHKLERKPYIPQQLMQPEDVALTVVHSTWVTQNG